MLLRYTSRQHRIRAPSGWIEVRSRFEIGYPAAIGPSSTSRSLSFFCSYMSDHFVSFGPADASSLSLGRIL
jgi:hypothetical protein